AERRDILLHVESNLRELARRDHVNASCSCGPKNRIACFARSAGIGESIPVTAWAVSAVRSASGLGERIVDADTIRAAELAACVRHEHALEVSGLLRERRKRVQRWRLTGVTEAAVVTEEEELVLPRTERNEWTAEIDTVLVGMFDRFLRLARRGVGNGAEEAPCIQCGVTEEFVNRPVVLIATRLDGVVLNTLAFVHRRVAVGLHLELLNCIDRHRGPDIAR